MSMNSYSYQYLVLKIIKVAYHLNYTLLTISIHSAFRLVKSFEFLESFINGLVTIISKTLHFKFI